MSADDHVCLAVETVRDKVGETHPVTAGKALKRDNRHDRVRVICNEADERFGIELETRCQVL